MDARIVAIDGRSAAGKTTLAERLRSTLSGAAVVPTDDIAWEHARLDWDELMVSGVLEPLHQGQAVKLRPPAWTRHGRPGHVEVPAGALVVILEGVGASRRELSGLVDRNVWVQSDAVAAERRGIRRDGGRAAAVTNWHEWMAEERPFLAEEQAVVSRRRDHDGSGS